MKSLTSCLYDSRSGCTSKRGACERVSRASGVDDNPFTRRPITDTMAWLGHRGVLREMGTGAVLQRASTVRDSALSKLGAHLTLCKGDSLVAVNSTPVEELPTHVRCRTHAGCRWEGCCPRCSALT